MKRRLLCYAGEETTMSAAWKRRGTDRCNLDLLAGVSVTTTVSRRSSRSSDNKTISGLESACDKEKTCPFQTPRTYILASSKHQGHELVAQDVQGLRHIDRIGHNTQCPRRSHEHQSGYLSWCGVLSHYELPASRTCLAEKMLRMRRFDYIPDSAST